MERRGRASSAPCVSSRAWGIAKQKIHTPQMARGAVPLTAAILVIYFSSAQLRLLYQRHFRAGDAGLVQRDRGRGLLLRVGPPWADAKKAELLDRLQPSGSVQENVSILPFRDIPDPKVRPSHPNDQPADSTPNRA